jgi:hypothetical protein
MSYIYTRYINRVDRKFNRVSFPHQRVDLAHNCVYSGHK